MMTMAFASVGALNATWVYGGDDGDDDDDADDRACSLPLMTR